MWTTSDQHYAMDGPREWFHVVLGATATVIALIVMGV